MNAKRLNKPIFNARVGDKVIRYMDGDNIMELTISNIAGGSIICGNLTFDLNTGAEIDEYNSDSWIELK